MHPRRPKKTKNSSRRKLLHFGSESRWTFIFLNLMRNFWERFGSSPGRSWWHLIAGEHCLLSFPLVVLVLFCFSRPWPGVYHKYETTCFAVSQHLNRLGNGVRLSGWGGVAVLIIIIIIMYIYHALINARRAHMLHINLNMIFYTHVEHSPTKTIYI